jgi:hypothetical protein
MAGEIRSDTTTSIPEVPQVRFFLHKRSFGNSAGEGSIGDNGPNKFDRGWNNGRGKFSVRTRKGGANVSQNVVERLEIIDIV